MFYLAGGYLGLYFPPSIAVVPIPADTASSELAEIPMYVTTKVSRAATIQGRPTIPMRIAPSVTVPMTRGLAEQIELPMQLTTTVLLERD